MASLFGVLSSLMYRNKQREKNRGRKSFERKHRKVDRDDFLLAQIDEFREKAQQLQEMLATKETKAQELQTIVSEREEKAEELRLILEEREEKAAGIERAVGKQIDLLIERVNAKMQEIEDSMSTNLNASFNGFSKDVIGEVNNLGRSMSGEINNISRIVSDDIRSLENNFGSTLEQTRRITEEQTTEVRNAVNQANTEMLATLSQLNEDLTALKQELSDKIHTENVKCFRNIQDLFKTMGDKMDSVPDIDQNVKSVKGITLIGLVVSIINTFGFVAITLYTLGLFG
ncbi:MAG: hypothetical protein U0K86_01350 [Agathobacter sp.]|nr:hypothetical protein [Agathobacter sp.]